MPVESPVKTDLGLSYTDLSDMGKFVFAKYHSAKQYRKSVDGPWDRWYKRYAGLHWDMPRPSWKSSPTVNFIFSTIETIIPIMTDNRPIITVVPVEPNDTEISEILGSVMTKIWVENDMDLRLPMVIKNTLKYGTGFAKVWWDTTLDDGIGNVAISVVDPRHVYPAPGATSFEDAEYVVFAANLPIATVERMYPEAKGNIKPGVWEEDLTISKDIVTSDSSQGPTLGPTPTTDQTSSTWHASLSSGSSIMMQRKDLCTLVELWYRDKENKVTCIIMANGTLLKGPVQPFSHNKFPFVKFVDYPVPGMFWAMGEIQQLEPLQLSINQRRGQITDILKLTANPAIIADADSGINPKALRNKPGIIILKNRGSDVKWMQPPTIPTALFELQNLDKQDFDAVSGIFDVTQGRRPVGIEAASAIVELQEAAQTRIRNKVRFMEASLRKVGQLAIALAQQFYTTERTIRIYGEQSMKPEFITINKEVSGADGAIQKINDITAGRYDVEIGVGSTMPVSKTRQLTQAIQLYKLGVIDSQAVLEKTGWNPEEINRIMIRMKQEEQRLLAMQSSMQPAEEGSSAPPDEGENPESELSALEEEMSANQLGEETSE